MFIAMFFENNGFTNSFAAVMILLVVALPIGISLLCVASTIKNSWQNKRLRQTGEPAQAKILKIWDTGVTLNDDPQVGMLLEVYAADRPVFQAETKSIVSRLQIPMVQVGSRVAVRYDRQDLSKVALVI